MHSLSNKMHDFTKLTWSKLLIMILFSLWKNLWYFQPRHLDVIWELDEAEKDRIGILLASCDDEWKIWFID